MELSNQCCDYCSEPFFYGEIFSNIEEGEFHFACLEIRYFDENLVL